MKSILKPICCAALLFVAASQASAAVVQLTWVTTVQQLGGNAPSVVGEQLTTIISVDNGGSSLASQSWSSANFLSYRQEGASGWFIESTDLGFASGNFSTDAAGVVNSAATWNGLYPSGTVNTSWAGLVSGGWWNNGNNQTSCTADGDCIWASNVGANQSAASWTASFDNGAVPVSEPGVFALMGLGLLGLAASRKRSV